MGTSPIDKWKARKLGKRGPPPKKLALLFRLKYLHGINDKQKLAERLSVKESTISWYEWYLDKKLTKKLLVVSPDRIQYVCPECLEARVYKDPETGEQVCTSCGYVVKQQPDMVHRLPFDETYALENPLVFNKSLGGTIPKKHYGRVLAKIRNNKAKMEAVKEIVTECKDGRLEPVEAGHKIREVLVHGGAEEIAEVIIETDEPKEAAQKIINIYDVVPIRQIQTLHDIHDPPLIRRMKEYAEKFRKQSKMDVENPVCDPDVFSVALGTLVEKVGNEALLDEDMKHSPRDLAAACFVKVVRTMSPKVRVQGRLRRSLKEEALRYVDHVLRVGGKRGGKTWLKKK